jgi:hypothetical protein
MDELEKTRHFIAHNRARLPSEYQRVCMYIAELKPPRWMFGGWGYGSRWFNRTGPIG